MERDNWHESHDATLNWSARLADRVANGMGSWYFIILQSVFVLVWMSMNVMGWVQQWDPYPFILLNLIFSTQAAYAAPIIMMSQNRQSQRDRVQAQADYTTNLAAKQEIEALQLQIQQLETNKLDYIIRMLQQSESTDKKASE